MDIDQRFIDSADKIAGRKYFVGLAYINEVVADLRQFRNRQSDVP